MSELGFVSFRQYEDAVREAYLEGFEQATRDVSSGRGADHFGRWGNSEAHKRLEEAKNGD